MGQKIKEFKVSILPGRHDVYGIKEYVETSMLSIASTRPCGIVADFGSVKLAAGVADYMPRIVPREAIARNEVLTFDKSNVKTVYESCELLIRVTEENSRKIQNLLDDLRQDILKRGGRTIQHTQTEVKE